jgi:hypothetical protein
MSRLGLLLPFLAASLSRAADAPIPCKVREIAFVHSNTVGTWNDNTYRRRLTPNLPVCSDSELVRVKDGKQSAKDQLVLKDLFGGELILFNCQDLLNCERPIQLAEMKAKVQQKLKGRTPGESYNMFKRSHTGQTSTISRSTVIAPRGKYAEDAWLEGAVVKAGQPLQAGAVAASGTLSRGYDLDLCLNADQKDCGTSLPKSSKYQPGQATLPFGSLPLGLHMLYQVKTLEGDTVPLRTEDRAFVLAVDPSLPEDALDELRAKLTLAWMDPTATPAQLSNYVAYLTSQAAKLAKR